MILRQNKSSRSEHWLMTLHVVSHVHRSQYFTFIIWGIMLILNQVSRSLIVKRLRCWVHWFYLSLQRKSVWGFVTFCLIVLYWMKNGSPFGNLPLRSSQMLLIHIHLVHSLNLMHILQGLKIHHWRAIFAIWSLDLSPARNQTVWISKIELILVRRYLNVIINTHVVSVNSTHLIDAWVEIHIVASAKSSIGWI